jgi:glycosyltransferase involved in cell wall biosynthesis
MKRNINLFWDFFAFWELVALIKKEKPDIIHLNSSKAGFTGSFAGKLAGVKVIYTAHGFVFNEPLSPVRRQLYKDAERLASMFRDFIIAVSDADMESAVKNKTIGEDKISVIHNGIAAINFLDREAARTHLNLPKDKFIFGTVAGFYRTKGIDVLIETICQLPKVILEKSQFIFIGGGPEFENCKLKIENLKLGRSIRLMGKIASADKYLKAFDCFILPSRKEGFSYTLLEAMQAGLPIIATNVGGNKEALGSDAILIESENTRVLAQAIVNIFDDKEKQRSLSEQAKNRWQNFTEEKMFAETKKVYEKILQA